MSQLRNARLLAATVLTLLFALALDASAAGGGLEDEFARGAAAHQQRDYKTALRIWMPLAEKGQVDAQYNVARMLQDGDGAAQNFSEAMKWYRKAAEQGDKESQYHLGMMYLRGEGVTANEAEAQKWFAMNRQHHVLHQDHAQWQKWQRQLAELNQETRLR